MTAPKAPRTRRPVRGFRANVPRAFLYTRTNRIYGKLFKAKGGNGQLDGDV